MQFLELSLHSHMSVSLSLSLSLSLSGMWCVVFGFASALGRHIISSLKTTHTHTPIVVELCLCVCVCVFGLSFCNLFSPALVFTSIVKCECVFVCERECNYFSTHTSE